MVQIPLVVSLELLPHALNGVDQAMGEMAVEEQVPEGLFQTLGSHKDVPGNGEDHGRHQVLGRLFSSGGQVVPQDHAEKEKEKEIIITWVTKLLLISINDVMLMSYHFQASFVVL